MTGSDLQVVPDDTHDWAHALLRQIWVEQSCKHVPPFYSTDNVGKEQYTAVHSFGQIIADRLVANPSRSEEPPVVLQDVFHARERVVRTLKRGHSDYFAALAELKAVFGR